LRYVHRGYGEPIKSVPFGPVVDAFDPQLYDRFRYRSSSGSVSSWYSTATFAGGFWGGSTTNLTYRNARVRWGAGAQVCHSPSFGISGTVARIVIVGVDNPITLTLTNGIFNFSIQGPNVSTATTYCSTQTAGTWEFAFIENPTTVVREWSGADMGEPDFVWPEP